jgi:hypothetical protein
MKTNILLVILVLFPGILPVLYGGEKAERIEQLFGKENLVAWCIVPFDKKERNPVQRAAMLKGLGILRCAYDWREKHIPEFEQEILEYRKQGIEYTAFWSSHEGAFKLFEKHGVSPQIWMTLKSSPEGDHEWKVAAAAKELLPLVERTREMGSKLGLYNHGGWGGKPENMATVCKYLREHHQAGHVGIVYNFHHGHGDIQHFEKAFTSIFPYLLCVNLNGMADAEQVRLNAGENKILPIGSGKNEQVMMQIILDSDYMGPIGILGHIASQDVEVSLRNNLEGLKKIKEQLETRN